MIYLFKFIMNDSWNNAVDVSASVHWKIIEHEMPFAWMQIHHHTLYPSLSSIFLYFSLMRTAA